ncbi:MAG: type I methionyl aminopeptidase [Candidatus Gracilibacteria bacterium]|nr:type I methionyl aminopeptidase [Candidatus Gracilibacteria bacterium]
MGKKLPKLLTPREVEQMRKNAKIHKKIFEKIREVVKPGTTAVEIDKLCGDMARDAGVLCAFRGQYGFPANICISSNDVVAHGVPHEGLVFHEGDLVNFDFGIKDKQLGIYTDSGITFVIGGDDKNPVGAHMVEVNKKALYAGIAQARAGNTIGDIGYAIQTVVEDAGFHIIRDLSGHGIGKKVHEEPYIYNYGTPGTGLKLKAGMTIAIEPLIGEKTGNITDEGGFELYVSDGSLGCQYEHTILITEGEAEIII